MSSSPIPTANSTQGILRCGPFELGYSVEGNGPAALVVGSSIYYPRTFSSELRQHLRLAFIDHRGFGKPVGEFNPADYSFDVVLDDIERMRRHLNLEKVAIVGHSGHGYMALEYAKRYPQNVSHVVIVATGPSHSAAHTQATEQHFQEAVCPERKAQLERDWQLLPAEIDAVPEKRFITYCLRLGARSWFDPHFDAAPLWDGVEVNMPVIDHLWGEVFRDLDITQGLAELSCPVLLALGRFDYLVAPGYTWEPYRSLFQDLTVRVFDHSSHTPQFEESALFDQELIHWLSKDG